ncbi:MAG: acyltransferase, partial [bacterium]|nr:acyltransferase [bacterium]
MATTPAQTTSRSHWLDHLRGLTFLLLAVDHSFHAYGDFWGKTWFIKDEVRHWFPDIIHMFGNSVVMPMLFFIFGMWVIPALNRHGVVEYSKKRIIKLGIPYVLGITFLVPLLVYPRYEVSAPFALGLSDFWPGFFFEEKLQAGPLWVVFCLFLFTLVLGVFYFALRNVPTVGCIVSALGRFIEKSPLQALAAMILGGTLILTITDVVWGARWWYGFFYFKIFSLQGSRFLFHAFYFLMGALIGGVGLLDKPDFWEKISKYWKVWVGLVVLFGVFYIGYALNYSETAYSEVVRHFVNYYGGTWGESWPFIKSEVPGIALRTTLHSAFCAFQVLLFISLSYRFLQKPTPLLTKIAQTAFGVFLFHETFVVWGQYLLIGASLPTFSKALIVFCIGVTL